jgi:hypothetical protein
MTFVNMNTLILIHKIIVVKIFCQEIIARGDKLDYIKFKSSAAQQLRENIDKWDFIKLKSFFSTKVMLSKLKRPPTEWEKI